MLSRASDRSPVAAAVFGSLLVTVAGIGVWLGSRTQYYPFTNDFWPLLFQASTFDWAKPESFKNGFFPPGYGVFLALIGGTYVLAKAYYVNLSFAVGTVLATYLATTSLAGRAAGVAAAALTAFHPISMALMGSTGPDTGCVFMLFTAFCLLHAASGQESKRRGKYGWIAGVLFFAGILWRYHALVYALAALTAVFVIRRRVMWQAVAGLAAALSILGSLSLFPGFSDQLARAQAFGLWEALHPVNWYHMPKDIPATIAAIIRAEPEAFLRTYWEFHRPYLWLLLPPIVAAALTRERQRQMAISILILEALYLPVVGLGFSRRGFAPVVPATMVCVGLLIDGIHQRLSAIVPRQVAVAVPVAVVFAIVARPWWNGNRAFIEASIVGYEWRRAVELELRAQGVTTPLQVFGDAGFHFVLHPGPGWYSYLSRSNGGWPRLDLYDLDRIAPELRTDSLDAFLQDCERKGITHILVSATAGALLPELGQVYGGQRTHPSLRHTATVAGLKVFVLQPS